MNQNEMFSIRQMIELTGLSEFTIRGWENRYSAFKPDRGETGRREYSKHDIERALLLRELLKRGHKISKIAQLSNQKLQGLFERFEDHHPESKAEVHSKSVTRSMELVALQKWAELSDLVKSIPTKNTIELIENFFLPAISELSMRVQQGLVSVAQEHVFSSFLKEKIYSVLSDLQTSPKSKKIRFVMATPEGDYHEIGLLLAHLLTRSHGFTSLYLGPHTPARDFSETAMRFEASHLLIVSTVSKKNGARQELLSYVSDIQKKVGSQLRILLAGSQAPRITSEDKSPLIQVPDFQVFENYLRSLDSKK